MAVSVLVAVGNIADDLVKAISSRMADLKIGDGTDPTSQMGPLITAEHRERVASYVAGAVGEGATLVVDGRSQQFDSNGFFIGVSLVDHVKPGMKVYDDEIFGPVLSVVRVDTYTDAVRLVNDNQFGNGTAIFTRRRSGAAVRVRCRSGHGGRQRAHPGPGGHLLVWRLEELPVRRHPHVRTRQHPLLHPGQSGDHPLAGPINLRH